MCNIGIHFPLEAVVDIPQDHVRGARTLADRQYVVIRLLTVYEQVGGDNSRGASSN